MTTYNTGNPLGSAAAKDLYDNAQNFDHLSNDQENELWPDRFGKNRLTWHGMEERYKTALANLGLNPVGTFQGGAVINSAGDIIQDETTGAWYRWDDLTTLPKTVPSGSTPDSTGGTGVGKWLAVDVSLMLSTSLTLTQLELPVVLPQFRRQLMPTRVNGLFFLLVTIFGMVQFSSLEIPLLAG